MRDLQNVSLDYGLAIDGDKDEDKRFMIAFA